MWWNFVGRTHEEIVAFREQWQAEGDRFGTVDGYIGRGGPGRNADGLGRLPAPRRVCRRSSSPRRSPTPGSAASPSCRSARCSSRSSSRRGMTIRPRADASATPQERTSTSSRSRRDRTGRGTPGVRGQAGLNSAARRSGIEPAADDDGDREGGGDRDGVNRQLMICLLSSAAIADSRCRHSCRSAGLRRFQSVISPMTRSGAVLR